MGSPDLKPRQQKLISDPGAAGLGLPPEGALGISPSGVLDYWIVFSMRLNL